MVSKLTWSALLIACLFSMPLAAQDVQPHPPEILLTVSGESSPPVNLTAADLAKLPRRTVRASDHGKEGVFEGVLLGEVLKLAGVSLGEKLHGGQLALYLVVEASDGYRAVFALPEVDSAFTDREILLTDRRDGQPLSAKEGPLRIVVPDEKRQARWVRQVIALRIQRDSGRRP